MRLIFEILAIMAVVLIALTVPPARTSRWSGLRHAFLALARRQWLAVLLVGLSVFAIETSYGLLVQKPLAANMDEFSYLLAGDTFAQGRLTNPTHRLWEHFESYNIILRPSYQSKYPPGQGLVLAIGQFLFGEPCYGVWISLSLACAAVCWMLYGWLPVRWALLGSILTVLNVAMLRHWGQSYWGGAVAMLGGALMFGALPRIKRRPTVLHAVLLALGAIILANSRPYEGLLAALPTAALVIWWLIQTDGEARWAMLRRVFLPAAAVVILGFGWIATYNYRVTGDPLTPPYLVWQNTYSTYRSVGDVFFFWRQRTVPDHSPQRVLRRKVSDELWEEWNQRQSDVKRKIAWQWQFYVTLTMTPALAGLYWARRNRWTRFAVFAVGLVMAAILVQNTHGYAHYAAPVACLISFLLVQGLRYLRCLSVRGRPAGIFLFRGLIAIHLVSVVLLQGYFWITHPQLPDQRWAAARQNLEQQLERLGGSHVVLVSYPEEDCRTTIWEEWVYNRADIDASKVIWARDLGAEQNSRLEAYYPDRTMWSLRVGRYELRQLKSVDAAVTAEKPPDATSPAPEDPLTDAAPAADSQTAT